MLRPARPKNQNLVAHAGELLPPVEAGERRGDGEARGGDGALGGAEARSHRRRVDPAEDDAEPHGEEHHDPRHRRHGVALVLPAHLAVGRDEHEPAGGAHPEEDRRPPRAPGEERDQRHQDHDPAPTPLGEVVLRVAVDHVLEEGEVLVPLLPGRHVRIVEAELGDGAVGRPLAGEEPVGERLGPHRERAGHADARQRGHRRARAGDAPHRRRREHAEGGHADHRLRAGGEEQRARPAREPAAQADRGGPRLGGADRDRASPPG